MLKYDKIMYVGKKVKKWGFPRRRNPAVRAERPPLRNGDAASTVTENPDSGNSPFRSFFCFSGVGRLVNGLSPGYIRIQVCNYQDNGVSPGRSA